MLLVKTKKKNRKGDQGKLRYDNLEIAFFILRGLVKGWDKPLRLPTERSPNCRGIIIQNVEKKEGFLE